ncbi:MAG: hypothetical protein ABR567_05630, partial [Myxococcales bacterium]
VSWAVESWDDKGNLLYAGPSRSDTASAFVDPLGGIDVLLYTNSGRVVENYDEMGNLRWRTPPTTVISDFGGFVVDRQGNTFMMGGSPTDDKSVVAQWIDHDGHPGAAFKLLPPQSDWSHFEGKVIARVGGGVFFRGDAWWQLDSMSTSPVPAPAWFTQRDPTSLLVAMVRNGRAYGFVSPGSGPQCTQTVEIVTASGTSCGTASFTAGPPSGGSCWNKSDVGYDGTFVQRVPPPEGQCSGGVCSCTWQWWTGFFQ